MSNAFDRRPDDAAGKSGQTPINVTMTDAQSGVAVEARDVFVWP